MFGSALLPTRLVTVLVALPSLTLPHVLECGFAFTLAVVAQDDVLGSEGSVSRPTAVSVNSNGCPAAVRLLGHVADRELQVLWAHGREHVASRQVVRRQPVRIDPDAHAVVLLAVKMNTSPTPSTRRKLVSDAGWWRNFSPGTAGRSARWENTG